MGDTHCSGTSGGEGVLLVVGATCTSPSTPVFVRHWSGTFRDTDAPPPWVATGVTGRGDLWPAPAWPGERTSVVL